MRQRSASTIIALSLLLGSALPATAQQKTPGDASRTAAAPVQSRAASTGVEQAREHQRTQDFISGIEQAQVFDLSTTWDENSPLLGGRNRAVLLDVARFVRGDDSPLPTGFEITPRHLARTAAAEGVEIRPGDTVLIRTGWGNTSPPIRSVTEGRCRPASGWTALATSSRSTSSPPATIP